MPPAGPPAAHLPRRHIGCVEGRHEVRVRWGPARVPRAAHGAAGAVPVPRHAARRAGLRQRGADSWAALCVGAVLWAVVAGRGASA